MSDRLTFEQAALGDLESEVAAARAVLDRLPDESWDYRPYEGAFTLGQLANHLTQLLYWMQTVLEDEEFDAVTAGDEGARIADHSEALLARFDELAGRVAIAAREADAESLRAPWTLRAGDEVVFTLPRAVALRRSCINHLVHHRAQLSLYLRLLGIEPPPVYMG